MIYETRMTVTFALDFDNVHPQRKFKTTLIEYINAENVAEAFSKAAKRKHDIVISISKDEEKLFDEKGLGKISKHISISLDAVVAKPEISIKQVLPQ